MEKEKEIRKKFAEKGIEVKKISTNSDEIKVTISYEDYKKVAFFYSPNVKLVFE